MANNRAPFDAVAEQHIDAVLQRLKNSDDLGVDLLQALDIAIGLVGADMGTLQRFDESADCLTIAASRGLSREALNFFGVVRRDTATSYAAAFTRRISVFVGDISTSYLFVGTRELDVLRAGGVAAVHATPLISGNGRLWGVLSTHFREPQIESEFDPAPLDRFALQVANSLEQNEYLEPDQHLHGGAVSQLSQSGE